MKILLTGSSGQVGWELARTLMTLGDIVAPTSAELNLAEPDSIRRVLESVRPDLIVNPAAYTAVDKAESEPELAMAVNGQAPGILAGYARACGARLVHYSTDYVFDGSKDGPYHEGDATAPLNVYGASKLAGEEAIRASGCRHLILRTSWVYGTRGKNFLLTMLRLQCERAELAVVNDQLGAPTWSRFIAEATAGLLRLPALAEAGEVINVAAGSFCSWYDFAVAIRAGLERQGRAPLAALRPIPASDYPVPARRPANSRLDTSRLRSLGLSVPGYEQQLALATAS